MTESRPSLRTVLAAHAGRPLVVPGIGSPLEARCAQAAGFEAVYQSGYATAAWRYGQPDVGLVAMQEMADALGAVTEAVELTVIADADTGYGDVSNVGHTVRRFELLGAAAVQLEDQAWPKRCGHLRGKTVIPAADHARKIAAAVRARRDADTMIIARTDALAPVGMADALDRAKQYADAGADALFVDAPTSVADLETIASALAGNTLIANMSESGLTPHLSAAEFYELGFDIVLFPTSALRIGSQIISRFFTELRATGDSRPWSDRIMSLDDLNALVGLTELEDWERSVQSDFGR